MTSRVDWRWIFESVAMLLGIAILPVILGILVDRRLQTFPITTLAMMLLGLNLGIVTICRRVALIYVQVAPLEPPTPVGEMPLSSPQTLAVAREGNSLPLGGDSC